MILMASKTCTLCLRTVYRQSRSISRARQSSPRFASRLFTSTSFRALEKPGPNETISSSIPPVTPEVGEGGATTNSLPLRAAAGLKELGGRTTETYTAYGATEVLYAECARQAHYTIPEADRDDAEVRKTSEGEDLGDGGGWWLEATGLQPTFSAWSQVTMLHMYLISARFRCFQPHISQPWQQHLLDHFFYDAEHRMSTNHNMHARGTRNKYLKDLFLQWRGLLAAYDEGLMKGDAVLAAAVWRNVFKASGDVNVKILNQIVCYMRATLQKLDNMSDQEVMRAGLAFKDPKGTESLAGERSSWMDKPLDATPRMVTSKPKS